MWYIVFAVLIVWIIYYLMGQSNRFSEKAFKELNGIENFEPYFSDELRDIEGEYPSQPILHDVYKVKPNPGYSDESYDTIWKDYPILSATSITTTNYRYWDQPDNGTCIPADMCNGLYEKLPPSAMSPQSPLIAPSLNSDERRINFYNVGGVINGQGSYSQ